MPWLDLGNPLICVFSLSSQSEGWYSIPLGICSSSTLLCHEEVPVLQCQWVISGWNSHFDLKPVETVLWPLMLAVLYPENWVIIWVDDWMYYCGQMSLPWSWTPISTSPKYLHEEIKKYSALGKSILPVGRFCFLKNISPWVLVLH